MQPSTNTLLFSKKIFSRIPVSAVSRIVLVKKGAGLLLAAPAGQNWNNKDVISIIKKQQQGS